MNELEKVAAEVLTDCEERYFDGDRMQLFMAVIYCSQFEIAPPDWVRFELEGAIDRYRTGAAQDLSEAFGIHRPKNTKIPPIQARNRRDDSGIPLITRVWTAVCKAAETDGIGEQLFASVAEQFPGLSGATVKNYYYEVQQIIEAQQEEATGGNRRD